MSGWTWAWLAWLAIFAALEIVAIRNQQSGDTLSETLRAWAGIGQERTVWVHVRRIAFLAVTTWLVVHLYWDWV